MPSSGHPKRTIGVLAGRDMPSHLVAKWAREADFIIAADAGADLLAEVAIRPNFVLGDMDSAQNIAEDVEVRLLEDQETTDCDKLLAAAGEHGCRSITLIAVEGDLLDHMLATLHSAARAPIQVRIALRTGIGWILGAGDEVLAPAKPGRRVSLLPLTETHGVSLRGVQWPLDQTSMSPLGRTSISNAAEGETVYAHLMEGAAFLFIEYPESEVPFW